MGMKVECCAVGVVEALCDLMQEDAGAVMVWGGVVACGLCVSGGSHGHIGP